MNNNSQQSGNDLDCLFRSLVEEIDDCAIIILDINGAIRSWNQGAERLTGFGWEVVNGQHVDILFPEAVDSADWLAHALDNVNRRGRYHERMNCRHRDGHVIWADIVLKHVDDNARNHVLWLRDATAQQQLEADYQLSREIYHALEEASVVINASGTIVAANPALCAIVGKAHVQLLQQPVTLIQSARKTNDSFLTVLDEAVTHGGWRGQLWLASAHGHDVSKWAVVSNIHDQQGVVAWQLLVFSDINSQHISEQTIWFQANFDSLTNLANRTMLNYKLEQEVAAAQRHQTKVAVLTIDLDGFKEVNDTYGHDHGDLLLLEVAHRLLLSVRHIDTVSRFGGDEFVIVLGNIYEQKDIENVAQKVMDTLSQRFEINENYVFIGASIGITVFPEDAQDVVTLLKNSDQAMYEAKKQGRGRIMFFTSALQQAATIRSQLSHDMRIPDAYRQFYLEYQPILHVATGEIYKAEALVRWQHPVMGLIMPDAFIAIAEENGAIYHIDDWVMRNALTQCLEWRDHLHPAFKISVNKSPREFKGDVTLKDLGDSAVLIFEITEGVLLKDAEDVIAKLDHMHLQGIQIALDDFGTGYSSLSYLNKFHFDYLKLDRSFVQHLQPESRELVLCEAIIAMAHKLDIQVIAEGVESEVQYQLLQQAQCDFVQGIHIAPSLSAEAFEHFMLQR